MSFARRVFAMAVAALLLTGPARSAASYTCQKLEVPGSSWTQIWQINGANQIAAGSSLGANVYDPAATPPWHALPAPPPDSGLVLEQLSALGINDAGVIAGAAGPDDGSWEEGFILAGSTYRFFRYQDYSHAEPRAISESGIVTGQAWDDTRAVGFVYNPDGAPGYAPGFTEFTPTLPDGTPAHQIIPGAMNAAGQFVGSANFSVGGKPIRYGFLYDPTWQAHGYQQLITLFQIDGRWTAARGLDDSGRMVGFTRDASGAVVGFLLTPAGHQLLTCPEIGASGGIYLESINRNGVISGIWNDAGGVSHGLVAYPDVVLPVASQDGAYVFDVAVAPDTPVFLDPPSAVGYRYAAGAGDPPFASVTLPIGIGDGQYTVLAEGRAFLLQGGQRLDFGAAGLAPGVARFEVLGIAPGAQLDPADPTAFVTEVTFAGSGRFTGSMAPLTAADELAELAQAVEGVGPGRSLAAKALGAASAYAAGDLPLACADLSDLRAELRAQSGKRLPSTLVAALAAEARAASSGAGCL